MPLHEVSVRIVQNQAEMVELDNRAKRLGDARQQCIEVRSTSNRSRKRQDRLIDFC